MSSTDTTTPPSTKSRSSKALAARVAALEAALAAAQEQVAELTRERDTLRAAYERLRLDLELLQRRIVIAKAERVDTAQLELEFATKLAALDALSAQLDGGPTAGAPAPASGPPSPPARTKPGGRRDLRQTSLPEERVEVDDPVFEERVARGEAERIGFEESFKLAWQRGGLRRLVVARVKYRVPGEVPETTVLATAPMPAETFARSLAAPSLLARIVVEKYLDGMPLHRQEDRFARDGVRLDRGTMCRWVEDAGATAGATVILAARNEAMRTAFCIATDATGVLVQPLRSEQTRQPCRRGHYLVQIADRDHVFFEYLPRETGAAIGELFKGFSGYVQADAKSVYDALFRPPDPKHFLLFAIVDGDAQGATNLSIEWVNAHGGTAGDGVNLPRIDGPKRAPTADALAKAAAFLQEGQAKYHWAPLTWHAVSLRDDGATSVAVDGFDIAMTSPHDASKLTLKKGGKLLASIDLVKDLSNGVQSPSRPKCGRLDAHVGRVVIDAAYKFAVFAIAETSRDGCFQSDVYAIHTWK